MTEMIERVARAQYEHAFGPDQFFAPELWENLPAEGREPWFAAARVAIEAMKVPTVEMVVQATEEWLCIRAQEDRAEVIWDAMIDAALAK